MPDQTMQNEFPLPFLAISLDFEQQILFTRATLPKGLEKFCHLRNHRSVALSLPKNNFPSAKMTKSKILPSCAEKRQHLQSCHAFIQNPDLVSV